METNLQEPPAIIELRRDAQAIARLGLYGDDCVMMGWTGDYRSSAPVVAFLAKSEASNTTTIKAVKSRRSRLAKQITIGVYNFPNRTR